MSETSVSETAVTEKKPYQKPYTVGEEIFNSVTHGVGALLSIAGTVLVIVFAAINRGPMEVVTGSLFGASLIILYYSSFLNFCISLASISMSLA